jgi:hypothetical protein
MSGPVVRSCILVVVGGALLAAGTSLPLSGQTARDSSAASPARIRGAVTDRATAHAVGGVRIDLEHLSSGRRWRTSVDSLGQFGLGQLPAGAYAVEVRRLGYAVRVDTVSLEAGGERALELALAPRPFDLQPLVVSVALGSRSRLEDFERRRALGFGSFVTRRDIEERHPQLVTDLLRGLAGVSVVLDRHGAGHLLVRGRCRPQLYIDGVAAYSGSSLDRFLRPDDVEGIEVYSTATVPPRYARSACGAVLIWTRVPERVDGTGSWWRGLAVAGAFLGVWAVTR